MKQLFYGLEDQERLNYDPEESIVDMFDCVSLEDVEKYDFPISINVFEPIDYTLNAEDILESILENLDDNYGEPDGDYTKPTEKMKIAAETLARTIKEEYISWQCEKTGETIKYSKEEVMEILT